MAIAVAAIVGGLGQLALQWPAFGVRASATADSRSEGSGLREVLLMMGPGTSGCGDADQLLVSTLLAVGRGLARSRGCSTPSPDLPAIAFSASQSQRRSPRCLASYSVAICPRQPNRGARDGVDVDRQRARDVGLLLPAAIGNCSSSGGSFCSPTPSPQRRPFRLRHRARRLFDDAYRLDGVLCDQTTACGLAQHDINRPQSDIERCARARHGLRGLALATALAAIVNGGLSILLLRRPLGRVDGGHWPSRWSSSDRTAAMAVAVVATVRGCRR